MNVTEHMTITKILTEKEAVFPNDFTSERRIIQHPRSGEKHGIQDFNA